MSVSDFVVRGRAIARTLVVLSLAGTALAGCGAGAATNDTYDLSAAAVKDGPSARNRQILIADPTALKALDSEKVLVRVSGSEIQYLSSSQWSDRLPRMVQAKLAEAFENTGRVGGVGKPGQGLAIDYQIVTDIRAFEIDTSGADHANVEISVKVLNDRNGTVKAQNVFKAVVPAAGTQTTSYIKALDRAFAAVTGEIVSWTLTVL